MINIVPEIGEAGKTTIYVRKALPNDKSPSDKEGVEPLPYRLKNADKTSRQ